MGFRKLLNWVAGLAIFAAFFAIAAVGATTVERFTHPIVVNANATTDANLGTVSNVANGAYYDGFFLASFTGSCNLSVNTFYVKTGKLVCLNFIGALCTSGNTTGFTSTSLPSALKPANNNYQVFYSNNGSNGQLGLMYVDATTGLLTMYTGATNVTNLSISLNWVGSGNAGIEQNFTMCYPSAT